MTKPNLLILGAQKAASTSVLHTLRTHRDVWMPQIEDPFLRDPVFDPTRTQGFLASYSSHSERWVGLKCPDYLGRPEVPARISSLLGNPKFVVSLRDPVSRAISAYYWQVRWGALPIENPNDGLRKVLSGAYDDYNPRAKEIISWGRYFEHLTRYLNFFPFRDFFIFEDQEWLSGPDQLATRLGDFLELDFGPAPTRQGTSQRNLGVYEPRRLAFLQKRNRFILKRHPDGEYSTIHKPSALTQRLYSDAIAATDRWLLARLYGNKKPALSDETLTCLREAFTDDVDDLRQLLGRSFTGWPSNHS